MTLAERLGIENQILIRDGLSQFQVAYSSQGSYYYLIGEQRTNSAHVYNLWSPLPQGFPEQRPPIYIWKPKPLWGYGNLKTINGYGVSHAMHTLENGPNGEVQICHWRADRWHSGLTLNKVMLKAILWLEAYEQHLSTGRDIADFVTTMQER